MSDKPTVECGKCGFRYGACHIDLTQTPEDGCANCECEAKDVRIATLESRVRELEAALAARTESLEAALASRAAMGSERDTLRAECDRLRGLVREAVAGMAKIADHGKGFTDEQMHLRIYAATYYRWAKDEAADLVARLGAE